MFQLISYDPKITGAPFDDLDLNRMHPGVAVRAILANRMQQDAAVSGCRLTWCVRFVAPPVLCDEPVILVEIVRGQAAPVSAGNADCPVSHRKNPVGIVVTSVVPKIRVETFQILSVEQMDSAGLTSRSVTRGCGRISTYGQYT